MTQQRRHFPLDIDRPHTRFSDAGMIVMTGLFFVAAFLSLGVMFWPYLIPYSVTVASAAAPDASLGFLSTAGSWSCRWSGFTRSASTGSSAARFAQADVERTRRG